MSAVVSVLALLLIARTLHYTRLASVAASDTLKHAESSAKAAWSAVDATREVGAKQARAYLGVESSQMSYFWPPNSPWALILLTVVLKNYGSSPAKGGSISGELELLLLPERISSDDDELKVNIPYLLDSPFSIIEVNGTASCMVNVSHIKMAELPETEKLRVREEFLSPRTQRRFRLRITWRDVFGGSQTLNATSTDGDFDQQQILSGLAVTRNLSTFVHGYSG